MPTVLITGANRGIGLEFARQYSNDGWDVTATARDPGDADELKQLNVRVEKLDMRDLHAVAEFDGRVGDRLDLLIANAGTWIPELAETAEDARAWSDMLIANSIGPYMLARSCLDAVAAAKGKLMALSSGLGSISDNTSGGYVPYRTSKAALNMAWRSLALETKRRGVVAAVLNPGWVKTRMGGASAPTSPEDSVADMRRTIDSLGADQTGGFFNRDGRPYPW